MRGGFIWDDESYVTENMAVQASDGLRSIWLDPAATPQYYPLVYTTFWLEHQIWGLEPAGYHVVNVLLHLSNAILLWVVLRRLAVPGAWLAAAVFALHPVCVESVAWITERKNVLSLLFYLTAFLCYSAFARLESSEAPEARRWRFYVLAMLLFVCALLSKTVACSLPAAILLVLWWKRRRLAWRDVWPLLPMFILGVLMALVTAWIELTHVGASGAEWSLTWVGRCLLAGRVCWFYAAKLIWPTGLVFIYPRWQIDTGAWWQYSAPSALVAIVGLLWLFRHRIGKGPLVGTLFFLGNLIPAMGFLNVYMMRYCFVADHFQYLASLGLISLSAALIVRTANAAAATAVSRKPGSAKRWMAPARFGLTAGLLGTLGLLTWRHCRIYQDVEGLWKDTLAKNPSSLVAWDALGGLYLMRGDLDKAAYHYAESIRVRPDLPDQHVNLGNVFSEMRRYGDAMAEFETALKIAPDYVPALTNLGVLLSSLGRHDDAMPLLRRAVALRPDDAVGHFNLGLACQARGQPDRALEHLLAGLKIRQDEKANVQVARILVEQNRLDEAAAHCSRAMNARLKQPDLHRMLGEIRVRQGRASQAVEQFRHALALRPDWPDALNNLAWLLATDPDPGVRNGREAVILAERASRLTAYRNPPALDTLAAAYAEQGRFDEAVTTLRQAIALIGPASQHPFLEPLTHRLQLYEGRTAYREPRPPTATQPGS